MLWFKALHIIAVVCWFAGLFYLPRLFVYHAKTDNPAVKEQFCIMEHRLYYYITLPSAVATLIFGLCLWLPKYEYYSHMMWLHVKLILVLLLYVFNFYLGRLVKAFKEGRNRRSHKFYRYLNEFPTIILIIVTFLVVVKPGL